MTREQEEHLDRIKQQVVNNIDDKYRAGQKEHGGNLWDRDTLVEAQREITDLNTYLHCASEDRQKARIAATAIRDYFRSAPEEHQLKEHIIELCKALHI